MESEGRASRISNKSLRYLRQICRIKLIGECLFPVAVLKLVIFPASLTICSETFTFERATQLLRSMRTTTSCKKTPVTWLLLFADWSEFFFVADRKQAIQTLLELVRYCVPRGSSRSYNKLSPRTFYRAD